MEENSSHYLHSTLRERILEHVFVGNVLRRLWQLGVTDVEVLRSEFDAGGYDLVMSRGSIIRHIQFKSVMIDGKAARTSVSLKLMQRPSGCVVWLVVTPDLDIDSYLWFGGEPGKPLPDIGDFQITKHTKGNAAGTKSERPNHRIFHAESLSALEHWIWCWCVCLVRCLIERRNLIRTCFRQLHDPLQLMKKLPFDWHALAEANRTRQSQRVVVLVQSIDGTIFRERAAALLKSVRR